MTPGVEGLLEVAHVGILLGVYARIREKHRKVAREGKGGLEASSGGKSPGETYSMKNFMVEVEPRAPVGSKRRGPALISPGKRRQSQAIIPPRRRFPFGRSMTPGHVASRYGRRRARRLYSWRSGYSLTSKFTAERCIDYTTKDLGTKRLDLMGSPVPPFLFGFLSLCQPSVRY